MCMLVYVCPCTCKYVQLCVLCGAHPYEVRGQPQVLFLLKSCLPYFLWKLSSLTCSYMYIMHSDYLLPNPLLSPCLSLPPPLPVSFTDLWFFWFFCETHWFNVGSLCNHWIEIVCAWLLCGFWGLIGVLVLASTLAGWAISPTLLPTSRWHLFIGGSTHGCLSGHAKAI